MAATVLGTRAAIRPVEAGQWTRCEHCGVHVKFEGGSIGCAGRRQIVCNVYEDGRWNRVEHYHIACYDAAGRPYGAPLPYEFPRRGKRS